MKQTVVIRSIDKTFANENLYKSVKPTIFVGYTHFMYNSNNNTNTSLTAAMQCCCICCMP